MKKMILIFVTAIILTTGTAVFADDKVEDVTTYEFKDELVDGVLVAPVYDGVTVRKTEGSRSLIKIRKQFIPEMLKSVENI